jgi:chromate transport protein ChrA
MTQSIPFRLHDPRWRFGAFGIMSNAMLVPLVGLLIAFVAAATFEHRLLQRVLGLVCLGIGAIVALGLVLFGLDALQVRQQFQPAAQLAFRVASTTAVMKSFLAVITLGAFGLASFRAPRGARASRREKAQRDDLVVGKSGTAAPGLRPRTSEAEPATDGAAVGE